MEENKEEKESSGILRQNKLPGSEKLTRPEELGYLSKFLGKVRKIQDNHTELPDWELGLYGRNSGALPDIKNLEDKVIGISENKNETKINFPTSPVKRADDLNHEDLVFNNLERLEVSDNITKLDDTIEKLSDTNEVSLKNFRERVPVLENNIDKLEDKVIDMQEGDPEISINNTPDKILGAPLEVILPDDKINLSDNNQISLESYQEKLIGEERKVTLGNFSYKLSDENETILPDSVITISDNTDLELPSEVINLDSDNVSELPIERIDIKDDGISELPSELITTEITDIDKLPSELVTSDVTDINSLSDYLERINVTEVDSLPDYLEKTEVTDIDSLPDYLEKTKVTDTDSLPDYLEKTEVTDIDSLPDNLIKRSTAESADSYNNVQDRGYSNWTDYLRDFIEEGIQDRLQTEQKDLLQNAIRKGNIDDNELFNTFIDLIGNAKVYSSSDNDQPTSSATEEWYKKIEAAVTSYMMGKGYQRAPITEDPNFQNIFTRLIERGDGPEYFSDFYDNEGYLTSMDKRSPEIKGSKTVDKNFKELLKNSNKLKVPGYESPAEGPSGTVVKKVVDVSKGETNKIIRRTAEEIVARSGLTGSKKSKALVETMLMLSFAERSFEKSIDKNLERLPGVSKNILKNILNITGKVNTIVNNIKNNKKKGLNFNLKNASNYKTTVSTGANLIAGLVNGSAIFSKSGESGSKNRPEVYWEGQLSSLKSVVSKKEKSTKDRKTVVLESANKRDDLAKLANDVDNFRTYTSAVDIPGVKFDKSKHESVQKSLSVIDPEFKDSYISSEGIHTTLFDLCDSGEGKTFNHPGSFEELKELLMNSDYITTVNKVGESSKSNNYRSMTLSDNNYWEIRIEPFCDYYMNGGWSYLPAIQEINIFNQRAHGINTGYNEWIPVTSFDYERSKLNTKSVSLYEGEIVFPTTAELLNELRISVVDDQYKSWSMYFRTCMEVAVYNSIPHNINYYRNCNVEAKIAHSEIGKFSDNAAILPTFIDRSHVCTALYKNITFRIRIYIMTPQYSNIKKFDLLCVLKDFQENYTGTIDAGGGSDLDLIFSVVGENPDIYKNSNDSYFKKEVSDKFNEEYSKLVKDGTWDKIKKEEEESLKNISGKPGVLDETGEKKKEASKSTSTVTKDKSEKKESKPGEKKGAVAPASNTNKKTEKPTN